MEQVRVLYAFFPNSSFGAFLQLLLFFIISVQIWPLEGHLKASLFLYLITVCRVFMNYALAHSHRSSCCRWGPGLKASIFQHFKQVFFSKRKMDILLLSFLTLKRSLRNAFYKTASWLLTMSELTLFKSKCNKLPSPNSLYYIITSVYPRSLRIWAIWTIFSDILY